MIGGWRKPFTSHLSLFTLSSAPPVTFQIPADPATDARYRVYASPDLANWTLIASKDGGADWTPFETALVTEDAIVNGRTRITVTETLPFGTTRRFHRLEGEEPPP